MQRAFETLQPAVRVRFRWRRPNGNERRDWLGLMGMLPWCRITAHEWRFQLDGRKENIGGLVPILAQCTSLEHLTICKGTLGTEAAVQLVASLGNPAGLVHLNLSRNVIKAINVEQLVLALAQCSALTHLDVGFNQIGDDDGGRWQRRAGGSVFST